MKISPIIVLMVSVLFTGCSSSSHNRMPMPPMPINRINNRIHHGLNHHDIGEPIFFDKIKKKGLTKKDKKLKKDLDEQPLCYLSDEKVRFPIDHDEEEWQIRKATENSLETFKDEMSWRDIAKKKSETLNTRPSVRPMSPVTQKGEWEPVSGHLVLAGDLLMELKRSKGGKTPSHKEMSYHLQSNMELSSYQAEKILDELGL